MRPFRSVRLLAIPAVIVPLMLSAVVVSGPAFARGVSGKKTVACRTLSGTAGGSWALLGCNQTVITGFSSLAITPSFPTAATPDFVATITWNQGAHRGPTNGTTTITVSVFKPKNKCASGSTEWELNGAVTSNTVSPAVKGKVKMFACVTASHVVSNTLRKGNLKAAKL